MAAKGGKAFFMACGQRDATVGIPMSRDTKSSGAWPEWAKRAYFIGFTTTSTKRLRWARYPKLRFVDEEDCFPNSTAFSHIFDPRIYMK